MDLMTPLQIILMIVVFLLNFIENFDFSFFMHLLCDNQGKVGAVA